MTNTTSQARFRSYFYQVRSLRRRVLLNQLPMALAVGVCTGLAAIFYPQSFHHPLFVTGLLLNVGLVVAAAAIPWDRTPKGTFLVIPYLGFLAVGVFRTGNEQFLTAVGLLVFFPVFWVASCGLARRTAITVSGVGSLLIVWVPVFTASGGVTVEQLAKPLLFPLIMVGFAVTVVFATTSMDAQRVALEIKDRELRAALNASQAREGLLETVVDTVAVGVVVVDGDGNDQLMNATQKELHALAVPHDIADPAEHELLVFGVDGVTPLKARDRPVFRAIQGETFTNYQVWLGTGAGARALSTAARPLRDAAGNFAGAVIAFHDVTEMIAALAAKDNFVANVSHEFRTPLTSIQGYLDMVLEDPQRLPPDVHRYLAIAARNVDRLASLVEDLLATDSVTISRARADVARLVSESLASAAPLAGTNKVELRSEVQASLDAVLDAGRIGQVLDNLVSNAVKYSPDGGTVTVRARARGKELCFEVQDTGLGMSGEEQLGLFTKFFRARSAVQRSIPGIGLGLMIAKTIVAKHGGTLTVESERGVGTTVGFVLPACVAAEAIPAAALGGAAGLDEAAGFDGAGGQGGPAAFDGAAGL
ncbi:two-component sensor histidine kinase [Arthrobacter livingstonensis]|uniref:histidine kinase n=1 Tax=Arthrobacter livingstonensis TaxID=670078 RepID=A0A2V5L3J2_9MICC|nr:ATP-binding protein [Arthrobacter livingstonensis]PYI65825.1 two-component sensor histidine kinase [Arthrobacter livingstonensis]